MSTIKLLYFFAISFYVFQPEEEQMALEQANTTQQAENFLVKQSSHSISFFVFQTEEEQMALERANAPEEAENCLVIAEENQEDEDGEKLFVVHQNEVLMDVFMMDVFMMQNDQIDMKTVYHHVEFFHKWLKQAKILPVHFL